LRAVRQPTEGEGPLSTLWTDWIEPVFGLTEIVLLLAAVYLTISQFTRSRASSYIERFNSSDAIESRIAVDKWLGDHSTSRERLEALANDPSLRTHLRRFANLFQELGAAYEFGVAHRKTVRVLFDALVVMYWESLRFWVEDYRAQADPTLYSRFESLYNEIKARERKSRDSAEYIVAYGSLMDPESLGAALGRSVVASELIPINLLGWERRWSIGEQVRVGEGEESVVAAFLDVAPDREASMSAAMVRVSPHEMKRLIRREKNYRQQDLGPSVRLTGGRSMDPGAAAWCFVGHPQHRVGPSDDGVVMLEGYIERVRAAARRLDPEMEAALVESIQVSGFARVAGPYEFVDREQASLV